jgi:hypothetical protein
MIPRRYLPETHDDDDQMMIKGDPYDFPFDGDLRPANTAQRFSGKYQN